MIKDFLSRNSFLISIAALTAIVGASIWMVNRAFIIGSISGIIFLIFSTKVNVTNKKVIMLSLLFLTLVIVFLAIFIKSDSSLGRVLIYKISCKMFLENPIVGIGWGNFQREYGLHQALYFSSGEFTQKEFLLAGNTFYAFNDYWELIIETGTIGTVCMCFALYVLIKSANRKIKREPANFLLKFLLAILIVVSIAALFTHVFEYRPIKILVALIVAYLIIPEKIYIHGNNWRSTAIVIFILAFTFLQYHSEIRNIESFEKWEQAQMLSATGAMLESEELYKEIYPSLKNEIKFLKDYNDVLSSHKHAGKKIFLLNKILNQYTDYLSYLKLAAVYEAAGMDRMAEMTYLKSVYIVPNRFLPKEALFNFYLSHNKLAESTYWREVILTMPVKIPSQTVQRIKKNVKNRSININIP